MEYSQFNTYNKPYLLGNKLEVVSVNFITKDSILKQEFVFFSKQITNEIASNGFLMSSKFASKEEQRDS